MILKINGKEYTLKKKKQKDKCSSLHKEARKILKEVFPFDNFYEEMYLPKIHLYIDFICESRKLAVEVNGRQHFDQIAHFHENKFEFLQAQKRDRLKKQILEENGYQLIELNYDDIDKWKEKINDYSPQI